MRTFSLFSRILLIALASFGAFTYEIPSWATEKCRLDEWFSQVFPEKKFGGVYVCTRCDLNVLNLIRKFQGRTDVSHMKVHILFNEHLQENTSKGYGIHIPKNSPKSLVIEGFEPRAPDPPGQPKAWKYHTILEANGKIYDFDFGESPQPLPTPEYFKRMFPEMDGIVMRTVPAPTYLHMSQGKHVNDFGRPITYDPNWWIKEAEPYFPALPLTDFMNSTRR